MKKEFQNTCQRFRMDQFDEACRVLDCVLTQMWLDMGGLNKDDLNCDEKSELSKFKQTYLGVAYKAYGDYEDENGPAVNRASMDKQEKAIRQAVETAFSKPSQINKPPRP